MPITLVTGPANAGKAQVLLQRLREHAWRGEGPWLVVPTRADVERYRHELAGEEGLLLGARVERFAGLIEEIARRAPPQSTEEGGAPPLQTSVSQATRERILAQLAHDEWPASAHFGAGFSRALGALVAELEVARVTPQRLLGALARWEALEIGDADAGGEGLVKGDGHVRGDELADADGGDAQGSSKKPCFARAKHGLSDIHRLRPLASIYSRYERALAAIGSLDPERRAARALDELRRSPALWKGTPVLLYGFDDLTPLQLDVLETLGAKVDAPITVSLSYERGRVAFAGRAATFEQLAPLVSEHRALQARSTHYAPRSRDELHHLERQLFEQRGESSNVRGEGAVRLLEGGGERAELELVGAEIASLLGSGYAPSEIALVHRSPQSIARLIAEVLSSFGIPHALERRIAISHTPLGRALLGLISCALDGDGRLAPAPTSDLLAWLRAPGFLERPELADRLEAQTRRLGIPGATQARALWERENWPLSEIDELKDAARSGAPALLARVELELERLFSMPRRGKASVLCGRDLDDAGAFAAAKGLLRDLGVLARRQPQLLGGAAGVRRSLEALEIVSGEPPGADRVAVLDPLGLRARRVRALFLCGLTEGVFPSPAPTEGLLGEHERRSLRQVAGLGLRLREDHIAAERYLLYAAVSRAEELLVLSWHGAGEEERPSSPSLFVEDVRDLFEDRLSPQRTYRALGAAHWPGEGEPVLAWAGRERALRVPRREGRQIAPLRDAGLLDHLREHGLWSASSLEQWASCPVRWFVDRLLRLKGLEPEAEPLARGGLGHAVLSDLFERLREQTGSARIARDSLSRALELLHATLEERSGEHVLSVAPERAAGVKRRLELDLERYLAFSAELEDPFEPTHLELGFGFADEASLPALDLGEGLRLRGRIDRIDVGAGGEALVYDYKGSHVTPAARWVPERKFQLALYMRAAESLLGLDVIGGLYQPLAGGEMRPRGALRAERAPRTGRFPADLLDDARFQELVEQSVELARCAAREADAGALEPRPQTCALGGGCSYPTICRCEP